MLTSFTSLQFESALGTVEITGNDTGISTIGFVEGFVASGDDAPEPMLRCMQQLQEYFAGERRVFDNLPLVMRASDFQQAVWDALLEVPYGETIEYGTLAKAVGRPGAARAVGNVLHDNPLLILVPCHRVLPASGGIGGYAAGEARKEWLLQLERTAAPQ